MNPRLIIKIFGLLILIIGISMIPSVLWIMYYNESGLNAFLYSIIICLVSGTLLFGLNYNVQKKISVKESFFIVGFGWIIAG
ncbi:MAG TPA: TrkH family potassium uptake protein, partial [bacterium]|nr:TrkH family potassium uptake protein [bacterium]